MDINLFQRRTMHFPTLRKSKRTFKYLPQKYKVSFITFSQSIFWWTGYEFNIKGPCPYQRNKYQKYIDDFLAHLSWKLKWAFLITCRSSSVCLSVRPSVCKLFTFSSSSPEPLGQFQPNLAQSILGWRGFKGI